LVGPLSDPVVAMQKLLEIARASCPSRTAASQIEKINGPFLFELEGTPAQYTAGLTLAIARGYIELHEIGTFRFTSAGADLFA